jgi:hypothetical protein
VQGTKALIELQHHEETAVLMAEALYDLIASEDSSRLP